MSFEWPKWKLLTLPKWKLLTPNVYAFLLQVFCGLCLRSFKQLLLFVCFFFFFKPLVQIALGLGMSSDLRSLQHPKIRTSQLSKIVMLNLYGLRIKHSEYTPFFHLNSFFALKEVYSVKSRGAFRLISSSNQLQAWAELAQPLLASLIFFFYL